MVKYLSGTLKEKTKGRKNTFIFSPLNTYLQSHHSVTWKTTRRTAWALVFAKVQLQVEIQVEMFPAKVQAARRDGERTVMCWDGHSIWEETLSRCGNADQQMQTLPDREPKAPRVGGRKKPKHNSQTLLLETQMQILLKSVRIACKWLKKQFCWSSPRPYPKIVC